MLFSSRLICDRSQDPSDSATYLHHTCYESIRYEARASDGQQEVLLDVPNYDFNWQLKYILEKPQSLPRGTDIKCTATYDNSAMNPVNPAPDQTIHWGDPVTL
jgi:hypothetical protein